MTNSTLFKSDYYLTDGGLETTLIFENGIELNNFASFELLNNAAGRTALKNYYISYLSLALKFQFGFIMETPTWRANKDWGSKMGYTLDQLSDVNRLAASFMKEIIQDHAVNQEVIISGNIGPRGDGYKVENRMTVSEATSYHSDQIHAFSQNVDVVTALTINYVDEAIGIVVAAKNTHIPVVISFTVETDGKLPDGTSLKEAIMKVDMETDQYAQHFMINCAHPEHFKHTIKEEDWINRIRGIRANASTLSHAELDEAEDLDPGNKSLLADGYLELKDKLPDFRIIGGCCGTNHTHLEHILNTLFNKETDEVNSEIHR